MSIHECGGGESFNFPSTSFLNNHLLLEHKCLEKFVVMALFTTLANPLKLPDDVLSKIMKQKKKFSMNASKHSASVV